MNYWKECIEEAFSEAGIVATDEQIQTVYEIVEGASENYGTYTGEDVANCNYSQQQEDKINKLEAELREASNKVSFHNVKDHAFNTL